MVETPSFSPIQNEEQKMMGMDKKRILDSCFEMNHQAFICPEASAGLSALLVNSEKEKNEMKHNLEESNRVVFQNGKVFP